MMLIVSDTGPINYLVLIGHVELLESFAQRIVLPSRDHAELLASGAPDTVRAWARDLPKWVEVRSDGELIEEEGGLSEADREAIWLARELRATVLLTDDRVARRCAARLDVPGMGTLGVLEAAAERKMISLPTVPEKLRGTSFYISEELMENALRRDAERRK